MVSMPNYVTKALHKFQHPTPKRAQYTPPINGRAIIMVQQKKLETPLDTSPPILEEQKRRIQKIVGTFLYYARAVYCTILPALNTLSEKQSNPTKNNKSAITQFL